MTIEEAASKFHWFQIDPEDGVVNLFLDHHSLSTFRSCEAAFELSMMGNVRPKYKHWNLEFGIIFHTMIEHFYIGKRDGNFDLDPWLASGVSLWHEADMDGQFSEHKMYKTLGGLPGFLAMVIQYSEHYSKEVDRLRVIGIEIHFGKKKEVPLGSFQGVRCYLTGRIDFLMDSGIALGPLDHKTTAFFRGNPTDSYEPQEGMTGYVFATKYIIEKNFPELMRGRKVDRIWMNFAQIAPDADPMKRFKRVPLFKTDWQLEEFRLRQLRTFEKIYTLLMSGGRPDWNTSVCNNMFHSSCQYRNLHRQNSSSAMLQILNADFTVGKAWDPQSAD
jgi:PD-(D/E)XK nuclease superfamily